MTGTFVTRVFYIASFVSFIVMCGPTAGQSQLSYLKALAAPWRTWTKPLAIVAVRIVNLISDLYLILIPLPAAWSLQLPLRRRIGLSAMFLAGLMLDVINSRQRLSVCIASTLSLAYRIELSRSTDNTWVVINVCVAR